MERDELRVSADTLARLSDVTAAGGHAWSCDVKAPVLSYLMRVDAAAAAPMVREAGSASRGEGEDCREAFARSAVLNAQLPPRADAPAVTTIVAAGPIPGDERRLRTYIGEHAFDSVEAIAARLQQFPRGTTLTWTYESGTASAHPERWTWAERNAVFQRVREAVARAGVTIRQR